MNNKYKLTQEENIFLAKKLLVASIYSGARIEGVNVTFPETQAILDGVNVSHLKLEDINVIQNLRDAWRYTLTSIEEPFSLDVICKINENVSRNESLDWGHLRTGRVGIGGTDYVPAIPDKEQVKKDICQILDSDKSATEKALDYYLYGCYGQLFWDGNKRTSFIAANKIMINAGAGLLRIDDSQFVAFNSHLQKFYDTGDGTEFKQYLYDNCVIGLDRMCDNQQVINTKSPFTTTR